MLFEEHKYRVKEVRKLGYSKFYPQQLMRSFFFTYHWVDFTGFADVPYSFDSRGEAEDFIINHIDEIEAEKVLSTTYHNVEI